jgi:adenylylsulfate kinase
MRTGIFIGRFQPFHDGHRRCVEKILSERDRCVVLVRDTPATEKNPFDLQKRVAMIRAHFPNNDRVQIMTVDDPGADLSVYIGRDVGYDLIALDAETEAISATDLRSKLYHEAGKSYNLDTPRNVR